MVVKVGTSSLTDADGTLRPTAFSKVAREIVELRSRECDVVLVSSGAIAAGLPALGMARSEHMPTLQAVSAVGQSLLMRHWDDALRPCSVVVGQVLLAPLDFLHRQQYLHARDSLSRLLEMGVLPVVNENDAVADDEIRFGDNDHLAALVAQLLSANLLLLLTDTPGVLSVDPKVAEGGSLIEEVVDSDKALSEAAGGPGSDRGSGGMATKVAAARMAAWSGVRAVIASAERPSVLVDALEAAPGTGTVVLPRSKRLPARKLWIAFALPAKGRIGVDDGARKALLDSGGSLLAAGVVSVEGRFLADEVVEIVDDRGEVIAKGLVRQDSTTIASVAGSRSGALPEGVAAEVVHRDDLVLLS